jgi:large subunit ribosomal protein L30
MAKKLKITQNHSTVGRFRNQKLTVKALGLSKRGHNVTHDDTPAIRGMINTVKHLVTVEEVGNAND